MVMRPLPVSRPSVALLVWGWVVAMAWSSGTFAEIYKWVDQKGVTNYSSAPPATGKAQMLDPAAATVSVYQAPSPQDAARLLDAMMRQRVAMLENQLRAEHLARLAQQASYQTDSDRYRLAYEQCLRERRVDCDTSRDGMRATPYFYAAAAPVFVVGRPFTLTPITPFTRNPPAVFGTMVGFSPRAGGSTRTTGHRGLSRKF